MPGARPADIFRQHGDAFRVAHAGHLSRSQLRVMGAIEACRTAALGGHVECCVDCRHQRISYNSCLMGKAGNGELAAIRSLTLIAAAQPEPKPINQMGEKLRLRQVLVRRVGGGRLRSHHFVPLRGGRRPRFGAIPIGSFGRSASGPSCSAFISVVSSVAKCDANAPVRV